jgi:hypothetical protein
MPLGAHKQCPKYFLTKSNLRKPQSITICYKDRRINVPECSVIAISGAKNPRLGYAGLPEHSSWRVETRAGNLGIKHAQTLWNPVSIEILPKARSSMRVEGIGTFSDAKELLGSTFRTFLYGASSSFIPSIVSPSVILRSLGAYIRHADRTALDLSSRCCLLRLN